MLPIFFYEITKTESDEAVSSVYKAVSSAYKAVSSAYKDKVV